MICCQNFAHNQNISIFHRASNHAAAAAADGDADVDTASDRHLSLRMQTHSQFEEPPPLDHSNLLQKPERARFHAATRTSPCTGHEGTKMRRDMVYTSVPLACDAASRLQYGGCLVLPGWSLISISRTHSSGLQRCIKRQLVRSLQRRGDEAKCLSVIMKSQPKSSNAKTLSVYLIQQ